MMPWITKFQF